MSSVSNADRLAAAAADRSARTLQRARAALADLTRSGQPVTVAALARHAQVSRSWLYTRPELLADLARSAARPLSATPTAPAAERATEQALLRRLSLAHARNRALTAEIAALRDQIAVLYGQLRTLPVRPTP